MHIMYVCVYLRTYAYMYTIFYVCHVFNYKRLKTEKPILVLYNYMIICMNACIHVRRCVGTWVRICVSIYDYVVHVYR